MATAQGMTSEGDTPRSAAILAAPIDQARARKVIRAAMATASRASLDETGTVTDETGSQPQNLQQEIAEADRKEGKGEKKLIDETPATADDELNGASNSSFEKDDAEPAAATFDISAGDQDEDRRDDPLEDRDLSSTKLGSEQFPTTRFQGSQVGLMI